MKTKTLTPTVGTRVHARGGAPILAEWLIQEIRDDGNIVLTQPNGRIVITPDALQTTFEPLDAE